MVQWLLVVLSTGKPGIDPGLVLVKFVMQILALGQVLTRVILFSPATIILQMLRTHFCSHADLV